MNRYFIVTYRRRKSFVFRKTRQEPCHQVASHSCAKHFTRVKCKGWVLMISLQYWQYQPIFQSHIVHFFHGYRSFRAFRKPFTWIILNAFTATFKLGRSYIKEKSWRKIVTIYIYDPGMNLVGFKPYTRILGIILSHTPFLISNKTRTENNTNDCLQLASGWNYLQFHKASWQLCQRVRKK